MINVVAKSPKRPHNISKKAKSRRTKKSSLKNNFGSKKKVFHLRHYKYRHYGYNSKYKPPKRYYGRKYYGPKYSPLFKTKSLTKDNKDSLKKTKNLKS